MSSLRTISVEGLAEQSGALAGYDRRRQAGEVNPDMLKGVIPQDRPLVLVGHLSHTLPVDLVIVLRCHPEILRLRPEERGWRPSKVRENVEAEAIGVITCEAIQKPTTYEFDTSTAASEDIAEAVVDIVRGKGERYKAGEIDWSEVILSWF